MLVGAQGFEPCRERSSTAERVISPPCVPTPAPLKNLAPLQGLEP